MTKVCAAFGRLRRILPWCSRDRLDWAKTRQTQPLFKFSGDVSDLGRATRPRNAQRDNAWEGRDALRPGGEEGGDDANEHGHVHGIFPFGDVEIRVNRFFDRNSRSIDAAGSHPPIPTLVVPPTVWHSRLTRCQGWPIFSRAQEVRQRFETHGEYDITLTKQNKHSHS